MAETEAISAVQAGIEKAFTESICAICKTLFDQLLVCHDEASLNAAKLAAKNGIKRSIAVSKLCSETLGDIK